MAEHTSGRTSRRTMVSIDVTHSIVVSEDAFRAFAADEHTDLDDLVREFCERVDNGELGVPRILYPSVTAEFDTYLAPENAADQPTGGAS